MRRHEPGDGDTLVRQTVLVTGGTGAVGPVLVRRLLDAGSDVRMLVYGQASPDLIPDKAAAFAGDINDRNVLREALQGVDVVFHLAAKLHVNSPGPDLRREYQQVNVEGTRCLADEAADAGVRRFVHFSTINVYGPSTPPTAWTEESPLNCDSWYAETKAESEQVALERLPATVLRMAAVYGPRMKGNYVRLFSALRAGRYLPVGSGANRRTLIHQEDVAEAAVLAAKHPQAPGRTYNVSDGCIHTLDAVVTAMCQALGRRPPRVRVPVAAATACAAIADLGLRCCGRRPFAATAVKKLLEDMAVDASKIRAELEYAPSCDLQRGWRTLLQRGTP